MAVASEWRIASAPARSQGSARCARRLLPPLTATGAPAHTVVRQLLTQLLRSATTGFRNTKFLTTPAELLQGTARRQRRLLDQPDNLQLLRHRVPQVSDSPSASTLF